ncbi:hypothetical protein [Nocardioides zeae]|uniref:Uncharacterized protein YukE n=1 Tax=Nocardioides zeae TaxID=1457234 RepID=A0AAJ1TYI5_9ACTN|nr:hypothetical protein [Nocardioides zeae]MDQ1104686.1 uncharacterized protein YukE [Nocardioides zeae]
MIETRVDGSPASVRAAATWLRASLGPVLVQSADEQASARSAASSSWEGDAADAYQAFTSPVISATDAHAERVGRGAGALDAYASQLQALANTMADLRDEAAAGGLSVDGTRIMPPTAPAYGPYVPGSPAEAEAEAAADRVALYDELVGRTDAAFVEFVGWTDGQLPADVADAQEDDGLEAVWGEVQGLLPNFASGAGAGLAGVALTRLGQGYRAEASEFRRRSRVSGDPRVRGQATTPEGRARLDDLLGRAGTLGRLGRIFSGPAGIAIDVGFGIYEGATTGDWDRAAWTTGTSIVLGAGAAVVLSTVGAPVVLTVLGAGLIAAGGSWVAGQIHDNWDDITSWTGDRWDDATGWAGDRVDDVKDLGGDVWDAVTPW